MKLSTKGRYGVRLMIELAAHYGEGPVLLRQIAERQEISEKYLWHLINPLKAAGLIRATRGAHGGYVLAKKPAEISIGDILLVLEGSMCLVDCVEKSAVCRRSSSCVTRDLWNEAAQALMDKFYSTSLADMLERQRVKQARHAADYSI